MSYGISVSAYVALSRSVRCKDDSIKYELGCKERTGIHSVD